MAVTSSAAAFSETSSNGPSSIRVGPLAVRTAAAEVLAFRELLPEGGPDVPITFPARWFAHPEILAKGGALIPSANWVPFHESQSFEYERPLAIDKDYEMTVEILREEEPSRLILRAEVSEGGPSAALCLRAEMMLRILPTDGILE